MHHRHLLPNEFDLLLDEPTGFGVQPLRQHVRECADCRAKLDESSEVVAALSSMPLLSPRMGMADRVMTKVPVFEPWHVAARDTVMRWMPAGAAGRALAATLAAVVGTLVTAVTLLIASRGDLLALLTGVIGESAAAAIANAAGDLVVALFGPQVVEAMRQAGPIGMAFAGLGFVVASLATVFGLRRIATSSRARS